MPLGPALLGLSQGIGSGMQLGGQIRNAIDQGQLRSTIADQQQAAQNDVSQQADQAIQQVPDPNNPGMSLYQVNGQMFNDPAAARAAATSSLPTAADLFASKYSGAVVNQLMAQGKPEQAQAFQQWSQQAGGNAVIKGYGKALGAFGADGSIDHDAMLSGLRQANAAIPNGVEINDVQPVNGQDGKPTGNFTVSYTQNGQQGSQTMSRDQLYMQGLALADPHGAFVNYGNQMVSGIQFNRDLLKDRLHEQNVAGGQVAVEQVKGQNQLNNTSLSGANAVNLANVNAGNELGKVNAQANANVQEYAGKTAVDNAAGSIKIDKLLGDTDTAVTSDYAAKLRGAQTALNAAQGALAASPNDPALQKAVSDAQVNQDSVIAEKNSVASTSGTIVPLLRQQNPQVTASIAKDVARKMVTNDDSVKYIINKADGSILRQVDSGGKTYTVDQTGLGGNQIPPEVQADFESKYGEKNPVTGEAWNFTPGGEAGLAFQKAATTSKVNNPFVSPQTAAAAARTGAAGGVGAPAAAPAAAVPQRPMINGIVPMGMR